MPVLQMKNVCKDFGDTAAVCDVSLTVNQGDAVAIIGASGSGKSTLLRCINHLETVTRGSIYIDGEPIVEQQGEEAVYVPERQIRRITTKTGMVFQHFNLFHHLTCLENITIAPTYILGQTMAEAQARARELLAEVGLEDKEDSYPSQLSGGQQQRVAIARALAMEPKIMLFDEPTSALDPEIIGEVTRVIYRLAQDKTTMLIVTHDMSFARDAASRVVYMDKGAVIERGSPTEIFDSPKSDRLQEFLRSVVSSSSH